MCLCYVCAQLNLNQLNWLKPRWLSLIDNENDPGSWDSLPETIQWLDVKWVSQGYAWRRAPRGPSWVSRYCHYCWMLTGMFPLTYGQDAAQLQAPISVTRKSRVRGWKTAAGSFGNCKHVLHAHGSHSKLQEMPHTKIKIQKKNPYFSSDISLSHYPDATCESLSAHF